MLMGPFSNQPKLDDLAHALFRKFARMEYALKATGYLVSPNGDAKANWLSFAAKFDETFKKLCLEDAQLCQAVDYILHRPPNKQVVHDGILAWDATEPEHNTSTGVVLLYVARIRNNLFHGGKFGGNWVDPERSDTLLGHALTILAGCITLSDKLRAAYEH